eukprot:scaffold6259_cov75-Skeletonema_marinoi.AAC.10
MIGEYDSKLTSLTAERDDATKKLSKALTLNMAPICPICNGTHAVSNCYNYNPLCGHANACEECFVKRPDIRISIGNAAITQIPVNSNIATTGHKLQGISKNTLIVNNWDYKFVNWVYVVLSRVRTCKGLFLMRPLDIKGNSAFHKSYSTSRPE